MSEDQTPRGLELRIIRSLKDARKKLGVTQQELGQHLGISAQQLSKVERGENQLTLLRFLEALEFLRSAGRGDPTLEWGFAEAEQAIYAADDDPRGDALEAIRALRNGLDRLEAALRRVLERP